MLAVIHVSDFLFFTCLCFLQVASTAPQHADGGGQLRGAVDGVSASGSHDGCLIISFLRHQSHCVFLLPPGCVAHHWLHTAQKCSGKMGLWSCSAVKAGYSGGFSSGITGWRHQPTNSGDFSPGITPCGWLGSKHQLNHVLFYPLALSAISWWRKAPLR